MIHLFNNVSMTPDCAVYKADKWLLVGEAALAKYQQAIEEPLYNVFDDEAQLGKLEGMYSNVDELAPKLVEISQGDATINYEIVASPDVWWELYTRVVKSILPNLDVDTLEVILACHWHRVTYSDPGQERGVSTGGGRLDLATWIAKPTRSQVEALFDSAQPIDGLHIDVDHISWEFQIATYLMDPAASPSIEQHMVALTKKICWLVSVIDRSIITISNLPDIEKLTGKEYDVREDLDAYLQQYPDILNTLRYAEKYAAQGKQPQDIIDMPGSDDEIVKYTKQFFNYHMPRHYDVYSTKLQQDMGNLQLPVDWLKIFMRNDAGIDMVTGRQREGLITWMPVSARHAFYRTVDANLLSYVYSIKDDKTKLAKFAV